MGHKNIYEGKTDDFKIYEGKVDDGDFVDYLKFGCGTPITVLLRFFSLAKKKRLAKSKR